MVNVHVCCGKSNWVDSKLRPGARAVKNVKVHLPVSGMLRVFHKYLIKNKKMCAACNSRPYGADTLSLAYVLQNRKNKINKSLCRRGLKEAEGKLSITLISSVSFSSSN